MLRNAFVPQVRNLPFQTSIGPLVVVKKTRGDALHTCYHGIEALVSYSGVEGVCWRVRLVKIAFAGWSRHRHGARNEELRCGSGASTDPDAGIASRLSFETLKERSRFSGLVGPGTVSARCADGHLPEPSRGGGLFQRQQQGANRNPGASGARRLPLVRRGNRDRFEEDGARDDLQRCSFTRARDGIPSRFSRDAAESSERLFAKGLRRRGDRRPSRSRRNAGFHFR
jgi:hypothetical protein